jgi:hypothetical protein
MELPFPLPMPDRSWERIAPLRGKTYTCGYCGREVGSKEGYTTSEGYDSIYICPVCGQPSYFGQEMEQVPGVLFGRDVANLPDDIELLYQEARNCMAVSAYTCAVLACRKLLMNVAVSNGASPNQPFIDYVNYLESNNYIPPNARGWVDKIRQRGNEANHEIIPMTEEEAREIISLVEMLLMLIYDFPARVT